MPYKEIETMKITDGIKNETRDLTEFIEENVAYQITDTEEFIKFAEELFEDEENRKNFFEAQYDFEGNKILSNENKNVKYKDIECLVGEVAKEAIDSDVIERVVFRITTELLIKETGNCLNSFISLKNKYQQELYNYRKNFNNFIHYAYNEIGDKYLLPEDIFKAYDGTLLNLDKEPEEAFKKIALTKEQVDDIKEENKQYYEKLEETKRVIEERKRIIDEAYEKGHTK